eukprot:420750-Amphidinium_carterae.1
MGKQWDAFSRVIPNILRIDRNASLVVQYALGNLRTAAPVSETMYSPVASPHTHMMTPNRIAHTA